MAIFISVTLSSKLYGHMDGTAVSLLAVTLETRYTRMIIMATYMDIQNDLQNTYDHWVFLICLQVSSEKPLLDQADCMNMIIWLTEEVKANIGLIACQVLYLAYQAL
ncbi:hypothetical protein SERLADRAFT_411241 [Serpula lacrymans var. lacrymans S7.9]|uniref:Uncharacterized protein n=1 Tax=Serpula lacrymans var. lacrymans (strain S7.9) TaxID=578457 RepID=F8P9Q3_SERL9|nr:uncharacterized protein SERLADRAFT_411241 [Serpula lacrymans var. lacrymans S7.9]EGO20382.1 hypothetical protein SERLADRAFT_411241 [Serpula lacrymans var. lacrymans S7.9]